MISSVRTSLESYLRRNSNNLAFLALKVAGIGLLFGISYICYKILCLLLPAIISFLIIVYGIRRLVCLICRVGTFPGSTWLWRRNVENQFQRMFVVRLRRHMALLRRLVEFIKEERVWKNFEDESSLVDVRSVIVNTLNNFQKQVRHKTLNKKQSDFMEEFAEIEQLLSETRISNISSGVSMSLWDFLGKRDEILNHNKPVICFEDKSKGSFLLNRCFYMEDKLFDIICQKPPREKILRWIFENSFGTLDQLREELDNRYYCKPIHLHVDKNASLDCVLLYGHKDIGGEQMEEPPISEGTIIYCCPNAGYYEYLYNEHEWVELYLQNGWNVFLWNYRGYGRSTGKAEPDSYRRDAEQIVDYLRQEMRMKKIGVHGESLGGLSLTHIGRAKNLDYMCADRTFAGLHKVVEITFGTHLAKIYRLFTLYNDETVEDYANTKCFKIITFDPKDEIIPLLSSLKYGITSRIILQRLGFKIPQSSQYFKGHYGLFSPFRFIHSFQKIFKIIQSELLKGKWNDGLENYNSLLTRPQNLASFWAISRLSELFIAVSSLNALSNRKGKKQSNEGNLEQKLIGEKSGALNSSRSNLAKNESGLGDAPVDAFHKDPAHMLDESVSFINEKILKSGHESNIGQNEYRLIESTKIPSYKEMIHDEASDYVIDLVMEICSIFEYIEAGGVYISDIMSYRDSCKYKAYLHFIHSFEVWGSYYPLQEAEENKARDISFYIDNGRYNLKDFLNRIEKVLDREKKNQGRAQSRLISFILDDLETIHSVFTVLHHNLDKSSKASIATQPLSSNQTDVTLDFSNPRGSMRSSISTQDGELNLSRDHPGFLVPLTCGHNGTPKPPEMRHFEYLFKSANLLR